MAAARRDSDASTRPRFLRNRPSGDRPKPGLRPGPTEQVPSDSREMEGLADDRRGIVAVACQCVCSLPTPTGRLGHCRLLLSLRHHCNQLSIELPADYARDSCSPAASQAITDRAVHIPSVSTDVSSTSIVLSVGVNAAAAAAAAAGDATYH